MGSACMQMIISYLSMSTLRITTWNWSRTQSPPMLISACFFFLLLMPFRTGTDSFIKIFIIATSKYVVTEVLYNFYCCFYHYSWSKKGPTWKDLAHHYFTACVRLWSALKCICFINQQEAPVWTVTIQLLLLFSWNSGVFYLAKKCE